MYLVALLIRTSKPPDPDTYLFPAYQVCDPDSASDRCQL